MSEQLTQPETTPDALTAVILWRVSVEEMIADLPRKRGERILRGIAQRIAEEQSLANVVSLREPPGRRPAAHKARAAAARIYEQCLPIFLARLRDE